MSAKETAILKASTIIFVSISKYFGKYILLTTLLFLRMMLTLPCTDLLKKFQTVSPTSTNAEKYCSFAVKTMRTTNV